jgi:DNA polymerase-3 subunit epsilon
MDKTPRPLKRPDKGNSLMAYPDDYTVVDVETNTVVDGVIDLIEVSALRVRANVPVSSFSSLVRPHESVNWFVQGLTGINDDMAWSAPLPCDVLPDFSAFLGQDVLLGHNVNYDVNVLYDNLVRLGLPPLANDFVDVLRLSRRLLPDLPSHKQTYIAEYFGIDTLGAHRALIDCEICHLNFQKLKEMVEKK